MKKVCALFLAVMLLLALAACGEDAPAESRNLFPEYSELEVSMEPAESSMPEPKEPEEEIFPPKHETIVHDWDGAGTLYPTAVGPVDLRDNTFSDGHGLLTDKKPLTYLDYETGESTVLCTVPDCTHEGQGCEGFAIQTSNFVANGKVYRIETEENLTDTQSAIYVGDKRIGVINGRYDFIRLSYINVLLYGDSAFLLYRAVEGGENLSHSPGIQVYLTEIDLINDEIVQETELIHTKDETWDYGVGYCNAWIECAYNGGIYLLVASWPGFYLGGSTEAATLAYYRYDLETGALESRTDGYPDEFSGPITADPYCAAANYLVHPSKRDQIAHLNNYKPMAIYGDWAVYQEDDTLKTLHMKTGEERVICEERLYEYLNGAVDYETQSWVVTDRVNQTGSTLYYRLSYADEFVYSYDFETGEGSDPTKRADPPV